MIGSPEQMLIVMVIALVVFGAKRLPELGRSLGQGMSEFKKGLSSINNPEEPPAEEKKAAPTTPEQH